MNIVAISSLFPQHHFVLAAIDETWPLKAVFQPVWRSRTPTSQQWTKLLKSPTRTIGRRVRIEVNQRVNGLTPQEPGRLFRRRDRSPRHDISYWFQRQMGT
jgi:hypothetical protein